MASSSSSSSSSSVAIEEQRRQANLRLLQRTYGNSNNVVVQDIVASAFHVVLYEFRTDTQQWVKCNTEGSLFVSSSSSSQQEPESVSVLLYHLTIVNRASTNNFTIPVTAAWKLEHNPPFLMVYPNTNDTDPSPPPPPSDGTSTSKTWGIWCSHADEQRLLCEQLQRTVDLLIIPTNSRIPTNAKDGTGTPQPTIHGIAAAAAPVASAVSTTPTAANDNHIHDFATTMAALSLKSVLGIGDTSTTIGSSSSSNSNSNSNSNNNSATTTAVSHHSNALAAATPITPAATAAAAAGVPFTSPPPPTTTSTASAPGWQSSSTTATASPPPSTPAAAAAAYSPVGVVMDKTALQLTLLSLLRDDRFLDLLHSHYLRVVSSRHNHNSHSLGVTHNNNNSTSNNKQHE